MSPAQLKLVVDSIVWAFRHTERNVAETGLELLTDLLRQVGEGGEEGGGGDQHEAAHRPAGLGRGLRLIESMWIMLCPHHSHEP